MISIPAPITWTLFFATTVYGHVAMKFAVDQKAGLVRSALSAWGVTAILAWGASSVLWMMVLEKDTLFRATSVSSLRYVLVILAAWAVTQKMPTWQSLLGAAMIAGGVYLARN